MDVITDFASSDNIPSVVSPKQDVFVDEEGAESKSGEAMAYKKISYDLSPAIVPDSSDTSSSSSPTSGCDQEFYTPSETTIHQRANTQKSLCNSPSELLQVIMNHVFKIAKQEVHQSPQKKQLPNTESPEREVHVESTFDLNLDESYTSYAPNDQDVYENIKLESPSRLPLEKSTFISHRKSRVQFYSPLKPAEQDFLQESLQASSLQSTCLLNESISYNDLHCQDSVAVSEILAARDDEEADQELLTCSQTLSVSYDTPNSVCPFCKKDFVEKYRRDRHMVSQACKRALHTHCLKSTGSGWFCELCPAMAFCTQKEAKKHGLIHKIKPRTCPVCEENFKDKKVHQLLQHVRKYHPEFFS